MSRPRFVPRRVLLSTTIAVAGLVGLPTPGVAGGLGTLVPAYFYPTNAGVGGDWGQLESAALRIPVTAIFNPASGPGTSYNSDYANALSLLEGNGGRAVGYVDTDYGMRPLSVVETDIRDYIQFYGSRVDGFFLDEMSTDPSNTSYYQQLYGYIESLTSGHYQVIGNPGTATPPDYLFASPPIADTFVTYEGYASGYTSANTSTGPSSLYANIIHDQPTVAGMQADVAFAAAHNVGYVYVTDQTEATNPYGQLPSYWDEEVDAIRAASVPEPGSLAMLASAGVLLKLGVAVRRRGPRRGRPGSGRNDRTGVASSAT